MELKLYKIRETSYPTIVPGYEGVVYTYFILGCLTIAQATGHIYLSLSQEKRDDKGHWKMVNAFNLQLLGMELGMLGMYITTGVNFFYAVQMNPNIYFPSLVMFFASNEIFEICFIQYTWTRCYGAFQVVFRPALKFFNILCRYVVPVLRLVELLLICVPLWYGFFGGKISGSDWNWLFMLSYGTRMLNTIIDVVMGAAFTLYLRSAPKAANPDGRLVTVSKFGMAASITYFIGDILYLMHLQSGSAEVLFIFTLVTDSTIILILQAMKWELRKFKFVNASQKPSKNASQSHAVSAHVRNTASK